MIRNMEVGLAHQAGKCLVSEACSFPSTISRVSRYSSTGEPVVVGEKAMIQTVRRIVHLVGRVPEGDGKLPV